MFSTDEFWRNKQGNFAKQLYYFDRVASTNRLAEELAKRGATEGTIVIANEQTQGRGRKGGHWFSPADLNLYFSMILKPDGSRLHYLPFLSGLAVLRALLKFGISSDLKWPNDVLVNAKKICGILIQTSMEENRLLFAIVGCGINVNVTSFPVELSETATSLSIVKETTASREAFLAAVILEFETLYEKINEMIWDDFCTTIEKHSTYLQGCLVQVVQQEMVTEGITRGLDAYGGLKLETEQGLKVFYAGEIQACRKK